MSTADQQIADILAKYGEPIAGNIWRVQGQAVIYHKALERIAAQAGIVFSPPEAMRLVIAMVAARLTDPTSKLATAKALSPETAASSLGEIMGLGAVDED